MVKSRERARMLSTVWTVFAWLFLFVAVFGEHIEVILVLLLGLGLMTLLATWMITRIRIEGEAFDEKAKRGDPARIDRVIDSMSEAEMAALRKRLMGEFPVVGSDGEMISLEELGVRSNGSSH